MSDSNHVVELLRGQFTGAHDVLERTMQDVTPEMAGWQPPGVANAIGAMYAHVATGEDALLNGLGRGAAPLLASTWAGKTGLSELPPMGGDWYAWGQGVVIDLAGVRAYAQAVYAQTDEYLASLTDADVGKEVDLSAIGFGRQPLVMLCSILISNVQWHTGEISCVKGLQGHKGYPF